MVRLHHLHDFFMGFTRDTVNISHYLHFFSALTHTTERSTVSNTAHLNNNNLHFSLSLSLFPLLRLFIVPICLSVRFPLSKFEYQYLIYTDQFLKVKYNENATVISFYNTLARNFSHR